ncbi:LysR family transcriptional regulator [Phototrophicus methaneseepsis]|uniref:LysR family transcriptional regulator n=1 Tax=Phototrophicus methaneseepsis TaxID=2710758 RepID=A0A7S8IBJ6_9CHLR|nr:LysR substrate-binding domain-containing protein [Phototrophicus methaneseepsis]QPC80520.1 LysR family transcriptional regulator [Phototrophicus methaneseepsis]
MNLASLRLWMMVAEHSSFSRAAEVAYISQPAISKRVQELEQSLGVALLDRSGRNVQLTEAGQILYRYGKQIFAAERAAESALAQLNDLQRGHLAVGASNTIGTYLLPALLGRFHDQYPGIELSMEIGNTHQMIEELRHKPLDVAFVEAPVTGPDLNVIPWRTDQLVVIAPIDHPLAAQDRVSLERLSQEVFIMREPGSGTREVAENALSQHGVELPIAFELGSNAAVKQAVIAGLGLAIISEVTLTLELALKRLTVLKVPELILNRALTHVTIIERPHSPALTAFLASLERT